MLRYARHRVEGQEPFGDFGLGRHSGFSKVTRCKNETISGRNRSNGYVRRTLCSQVKSIGRFGEDCVLVRSLAALDSGYRFRRSGP